MHKNSVLKILLQLIFTSLTVSEKTAEHIISILKTFIILYTRIYNEENSLKESSNTDKDKKDDS